MVNANVPENTWMVKKCRPRGYIRMPYKLNISYPFMKDVLLLHIFHPFFLILHFLLPTLFPSHYYSGNLLQPLNAARGADGARTPVWRRRVQPSRLEIWRRRFKIMKIYASLTISTLLLPAGALAPLLTCCNLLYENRYAILLCGLQCMVKLCKIKFFVAIYTSGIYLLCTLPCCIRLHYPTNQ